MTLPDELVQGIVLKIGGSWGDATPEDREFFRRFAAVVAAYEREECARLCEEVDGRLTHYRAPDCAVAIRARGEK
jgi:hypothetical protein